MRRLLGSSGHIHIWDVPDAALDAENESLHFETHCTECHDFTVRTGREWRMLRDAINRTGVSRFRGSRYSSLRQGEPFKYGGRAA